MLRLCTAYPQDSKNGSRSDRESALLGRRGHSLCLSFAHSVVSSVKLYNLDSTSAQFRLNLQGEFEGGVHERIQYADVDAKKANRNDEAEGAQTEIRRSFANEGAGPKPRALIVYRLNLPCMSSDPLPVSLPGRSAPALHGSISPLTAA
jgi:hypothetical protein